EIKIGNSWLQQEMEFKLSKPATLWRFSIDTVTGSEAGFERTHQGSSLTLLWPLTIEPGQTWSASILCQGREI
ncbi:MAG TPA: alpha-amylase/4-alpha-glucanotransferase domain-containing protein, partial [Ktedonobacteraceae bacterium]|nr:alpha-amylase/4-alpha-glucanotransferase domain-containing protein [Ktedonobacteraceae bacterium]